MQNMDKERVQSMYKVTFINKMLNTHREENIEAYTEQEAYEKFKKSHRDFCEIQSVKPVKRSR